MKVALAFSTKERMDFTKQTLPRILEEAEGNFDLYWLDGSVTPEGKQFPADFALNWRRDHDGKYPLKEMHYNVGGGPAAVIQAAWKYLYDKGYDYIGLIENDVLLEPGWFKKTMALFDKMITRNVLAIRHDGAEQMEIEQPQWKVGAVSARCFTDRILEKHDDYALMANVGAGMYITTRDLVMTQLQNWHRPMLWQQKVYFQYFLGRDYPIPPQVLEQDPEMKQEWAQSEDWAFEPIALRKGFVTLATVPSLAINLDDPDGKRDRVEK